MTSKIFKPVQSLPLSVPTKWREITQYIVLFRAVERDVCSVPLVWGSIRAEAR